MRSILGVILGASVSAGLAGVAPARMADSHHMGRTRYPTGHKPGGYRFRPHNGEREVARRLRQEARDRRNQRIRAIASMRVDEFDDVGAEPLRISRRGRVIPAAPTVLVVS